MNVTGLLLIAYIFFHY